MSAAPDLARVGVAIVTYASAGHIDACLDALAWDELGGVVVVDNASPDDTVAVLGRRPERALVVVEQANIGFGGGCNTGARALPPTCELVLFCNPDARISRDDLALLVAHLDGAPSCAMVGPRLRCGDTPLPSGGAEPRLVSEIRPLLPGAVGRFLPRRQLDAGQDADLEVGYVEGACMLVRRDAFEQVGGFDEGYFLCFEEIDLATRLRAAGWTIELVTAAWAEHCAGQSRQAIPVGGRDHAARGLLRYLALHRGHRTARVYARSARASLWLRNRTGRLPHEDYERLRRVLAERPSA